MRVHSSLERECVQLVFAMASIKEQVEAALEDARHAFGQLHNEVVIFYASRLLFPCSLRKVAEVCGASEHQSLFSSTSSCTCFLFYASPL